ncbi:ABC transporter substrate-binding protein [Bradyrhizobium pachyrhizi]|uniref:ABC transporter substrate-binding protein n=1 Tax=Bradyrhizobium pachyrhizi TaxID=280333 RepID=UPI00067AF21B|nr:ABC transporter substrate-binding protein [Bradyrhizobium pachyrhizi]
MKATLQVALAAAFVVVATPVLADDPIGVTATEIKVGGIFPYGGPASSLGLIGRAVTAYVKQVNDAGGINHRKVNYISYDDAYSPPKAVEHARKLIENDEVAFMFSQLGTPGNTATAKYLTAKKVPTLGIISGSAKFTNVKEFPLTTTSLVSFDTEGKIYAKYLLSTLPNGKYGILYQNDDLGKDYVKAFQSVLKEDFEKKVTAVAYEITSPTIESQIVALRSANVDALFVAGTPKFAAQAIRKTAELGWKPTIMLNYPSSSVGGTLKPAGLDVSVGVVAGTVLKDPTDSRWDDDQGIKDYKEFLAKYMPGADISDTNYLVGYTQGILLEKIIELCGNDLSRENIIKQAKSLKALVLPTLMPGITVTTTEASNMNFTQMQLQRWTGSRWEQVSDVLRADSE